MSSSTATHKRSTTTSTSTSTLPAARPPCTFHPTALVADKAQLTGTFPVEIAAHAVLHPYARIRAEAGKVTIGPYCVLAEGAVVGLPASDSEGADVTLESHVSVESGAEVLAERVGEASEVGVQARVGRGARVGRFCRVTAGEVVREGDEGVGDFTVVFGGGRRRVDKTLVEQGEVRGARVKWQERHVEALGRLVPDGKAKWLS